MRMQHVVVPLGVLALASLAACGGGQLVDMSGANYVGAGDAAVEVRLGDASATFGQDAPRDAIRVNELGRSGKWTLDFNDIEIRTGETADSKAYVTIELGSKPTVGTMRAKVTTEIFKPDRYKGSRVRESSKNADVVFDKVELVKDGAVAGRIALTTDDMVVNGTFDLRLTDAPSMLPAGH